MNPVRQADDAHGIAMSDTRASKGDVQEYLDAVPDERKAMVGKLHALILDLYPEAEVDLSYRMPTYRFGDGWVAIGNQKRYVSLYTCGAHHLAGFKQRHPGIRTGKGCINLKPTDTVPVAALKQVVRHAIEYSKG